MSREDEVREAPRCKHCHGKGCDRCQWTGFEGGREP